MTRLIIRLRWPIVVFWIALAAILTVSLPNIREAQVGALGDLVPSDAPAVDAERRSAELFGFPLLSRTIVVQRDPAGLDTFAQFRVGRRALAINQRELPDVDSIAGALAVTNALGKPPFSREKGTTGLTYLFFPPDIGPVGRAGLTDRLMERYISLRSDALVGSTGTLAAREAQSRIVEDRLPLVEAATALLVLLAVGLHFRALGAPLINAGAVAIAYLVSVRLVASIGRELGVSVPSEVEPVIVVLLFGVVTDYSIFFLSRFRERMEDGLAPRDALQSSTSELLPTVVAAGLTVALASGALIVAKVGFLKAFGPGMALSVLIGLLVAITFVPAALAIGGDRVFWPRRPKARAPGRGAEPARTPRSVGLAGRRPLLVALTCVVLLLAAGSGLMRMELGNPLIRGLPDDNPVKRSYLEASKGFAPGIIAPTVVVVERPGIVTRSRRQLSRLQRVLDVQQGVAEVVGPADQPFEVALGGTLSKTGDAARYLLVFRTDPLGSTAIDRLDALRARMPGLLRAAGIPDAGASIAGDTALVAETVNDTVDDIVRVAPATMLAVFLVLAIYLRALIAPLYLLASSALALVASLGLATYVFQDLLGYGELTYFVPFAAAVLLVALGSDYNVFLVGRVWREARDMPLRRAIIQGAASAARPIAIAGLVLAGSFMLLALVPVRPFQELAFTVALGLLIDAFIVRTLLVPALMVIAGRASDWPGRGLRRRSPREATPTTRRAAPATRVLVTGATGNVGHPVCALLRADGHEVRALVRDGGRARGLLPEGVEAVAGDVTDEASIRSAMKGCTSVYHAAGLPEQWRHDPADFTRVNVEGTRNMVDAALAEGVQRFVYTSTIDVFAWVPGRPFDETEIDPDPRPTYYERSKQEADRIVARALDGGLPAVFLHPSAVYGPAPVLTPGLNDLLARLAKRKIPMLLPGGMPVVFSRDVAEGHLRAAAGPVGGRYILSGEYVTLREIAREVAALEPRAKVPRVIPIRLARGISVAGERIARITRRPPLIPRGALHFLESHPVPVADRARSDLGWDAAPFPDGLALTLDHFRERGWL